MSTLCNLWRQPVAAWALALAVALALSGSAWAAATDPAFTAARSLGRGVSLGNMLEAPHEGQWGVRLDAELFQRARQAGFDTVRLPVRWSNHAQATAPYRIHEDFFRRVDFAVEQALRHGLKLVVNMHHYRQLDGVSLQEGEMRVEDDVVDERFVAMWTQIARRYRAVPADKLFFELYNEPHSRLDAKAWNGLLRRALRAVRGASPDRFVIIGPAGHNGVVSLPGLSLPAADRRIIVAVHLYEPYEFTHQGAFWVEGAGAWLGVRCCTREQQQEVQHALDAAQAWATRHDRPLWIGEFGSHEMADYDSRVAYTRMVREEIEARGLPWAYWQLASNFGIYNLEQRTWYTALRNALLGDAHRVAGPATSRLGPRTLSHTSHVEHPHMNPGDCPLKPQTSCPGVEMEDARLGGANLARAVLTGANFSGADLSGANLRRADLDESRLVDVNLSGAQLASASLRGANLRYANLRGARMHDAVLEGADLRGAVLEGADLRGTRLIGARFEGASLRGANLRGAELDPATLAGADIEGCTGC